MSGEIREAHGRNSSPHEHVREVGNALKDIRDRRLYRESHARFEDYSQAKWDIGRNYANKKIAAAVIIKNVGTTVPIKPTSERQARPLIAIDDPEEQAEAWERAVETAPKDDDGKPKITAKHVQSAADDMPSDHANQGRGGRPQRDRRYS